MLALFAKQESMLSFLVYLPVLTVPVACIPLLLVHRAHHALLDDFSGLPAKHLVERVMLARLPRTQTALRVLRVLLVTFLKQAVPLVRLAQVGKKN